MLLDTLGLIFLYMYARVQDLYCEVKYIYKVLTAFYLLLNHTLNYSIFMLEYICKTSHY